MSWIKTDDRNCITEASAECREGMTWNECDMTGWKITDDGVPLYYVTESGRVAKRSDADVKKDKRARG